MQIKTITASESIETIQPNGLKKWKKTEMTAEIPEYEDAEVQTLMLHQKVEATNLKAANVSPSWNRYEEPIPTVIPEINLEKDRVEILIDNAENLVELLNYQKDADKYGLTGHWNSRYQNLKNK